MYNPDMLRGDLLTMSGHDFFVKYIIKSYNWYFLEYLRVPYEEMLDRMDYFKEIVSSHFGISFHSTQIVGSAKTGFSLSPNKALKAFHDENPGEESSDIDIAIISSNLFESLWDALRKTEKLHLQRYYLDITKAIYRGYINDKQLIQIDTIREQWQERTSPINKTLQDELAFVHPITYRVYRSWEDLEDYQLIGIEKTRKQLEAS